jgi:hypothetical protein
VKHKILIVLGLAALLVCFSSCKNRHSTSPDAELKGMDAEKAVAKHLESHLKFHVLTLKGKADFDDFNQGTSAGFSYRIDIAKDSLILVNLSKFGIPAMSLLLSQDSMRMRIPLNNTAAICDYSFLKKMIGLDLNLRSFQDLLLGDAHFENAVKLTSGKANPIVLEGSRPPYAVSWILNGHSFRLEKMRLADPILGKESVLTYSEFQKIDGQSVASILQVEVTQPQKVRILLHHSGIAFDKEKVDFRFRIPASYRLVPCDSFATRAQ